MQDTGKRDEGKVATIVGAVSRRFLELHRAYDAVEVPKKSETGIPPHSPHGRTLAPSGKSVSPPFRTTVPPHSAIPPSHLDRYKANARDRDRVRDPL